MTSTESRAWTHVRWMIRRDVPEVLASQGRNPWNHGELLRTLQDRRVIGLTAERLDLAVAGWIIYRMNQDHFLVLAAGGEIEALLARLEAKLDHDRRDRIEYAGVLVHGPKAVFIREDELEPEEMALLRELPECLQWDYLLDLGYEI